MKAKRNLLIGIILGAVIGWALGFLRLPYVEKNLSFWLGVITCLAFILFGLILLRVWNKHLLLMRLMGKSLTTQDSKNATRAYTLIWILISVFIVWGGMVSSFLIYRQNELFKLQTQKQNKRIHELSELVESARKSNLAFLMNDVLDNVRDELRNNPNMGVSDSSIAGIALLSNSLFTPYRYFEGDSLSEKELSPERGRLLLAFLAMKIDSGSFTKIKGSISFSGADLRGADLRGADLSKADLRKADLKNADLSEANLSEADLRGAILWGANLNLANLRRVDLRRSNLSWAQLNHADLKSANLNGAVLTNAQLRNADLSGATFQWAESDGAMLNEANLAGVSFAGTGLRRVNLSDANLTGTDLRITNLSETNLSGAELTRAIVDEKWLEKLAGWRLTGVEEIQKSYIVVNDSLDKWKKPIYRLKKVED